MMHDLAAPNGARAAGLCVTRRSRLMVAGGSFLDLERSDSMAPVAVEQRKAKKQGF